MQLADTHTHLYLPDFDADRDEMINRSLSAGIDLLLMPNIDTGSVDAMMSACNRYPGRCFPMIGLHPTSVKEDYLSQLSQLSAIAGKNDFIAIGEVGIDLYWDKTYLREQTDALRTQIIWSIEKDLPLVVHIRESFPEVFAVLDEFRGARLKGVFHAFSGTVEDAEKAISMGFRLGIGGPLTYKNSKLPEVVKAAGIDHIVLETDSPYLSPVPHRGKRNESAYIRIINSKLAELSGLSEEETAAATYRNSCSLFKIVK